MGLTCMHIHTLAFAFWLTASTGQPTNKPGLHLLFLASLICWPWLRLLLIRPLSLFFFFYRSHFVSVKIFFTLSLRRPSLASKRCSSKERSYKCVCVWDKIGDNVNEYKEAVCRSVTIRKSLHWSRIITAEKPKNREFPSPSPKNCRLMWSSQLLLFFLLYLEFLLLVSELITSCLDLLTRTSASRYCRCHGRILCLFLLCSSFILVGRPVLVSHFPWGFLLLPSPALCSNVLHLLPPPPSTPPSEAVCVCPSSALSYFKLFPFSTRSRLLSKTSCSALWGWDFLLFGGFCCCYLCISMHWEVLCQNVWYQCRSIANRGFSSCSHTFRHAVKSNFFILTW